MRLYIFFPENNIIHLSLPSISSGQMFHIRAVFGSRKIIFRKYSIFRKCYFPERKTFSCVWLSQNSFYGKLILMFGSFNHFTRKYIKSGETLVRRASNERRSSIDDRDCQSRRSINDRDRAPHRLSARCDRQTSGAIVPLSL